MVSARSSARPRKFARACTHASGSPNTTDINVAHSEQTSDRRNAVTTSGVVSSCHASFHGARQTIAMRGRAKSAAPPAATTIAGNGTAARPRAPVLGDAVMVGESQSAAARSGPAPSLSSRRTRAPRRDFRRPPAHCDWILSRHVVLGGKRNSGDSVPGNTHIGDVDNAGVRFAQDDFVEYRLDVRAPDWRPAVSAWPWQMPRAHSDPPGRWDRQAR